MMLREDVIQMLRESEIAITPQRVDIAEVLFAKPQHVSAEQVIERLKFLGKSVSKATVYNTLNRFASKGMIKAVNVNPERVFYDSVTTHHHHFYNVDTSEIFDIPSEHLAVERMPLPPEGTEVESVDIVISVRNR